MCVMKAFVKGFVETCSGYGNSHYVGHDDGKVRIANAHVTITAPDGLVVANLVTNQNGEFAVRDNLEVSIVFVLSFPFFTASTDHYVKFSIPSLPTLGSLR